MGAVAVAHLASPAGTRSAGTRGGTAVAAQATRPEYYLTATYPAHGPNVLQFQVRRTNGGAVTSSSTISAANVGWGGYLTAAAGDRAFYFAKYPCISTGIPDTTFYRITITNSGQISAFAPVGQPIKGMVTTLAVSPDGSAMAYNALERTCAGPGRTLPGAASVSLEYLSTGQVRTWQDTDATQWTLASRLSWAPDGRTLVVDESTRGSLRGEPDRLRARPGQQRWLAAGPQHDPAAAGGANCSPCVTTALAGPDGSLTEIESQVSGQGIHVLIISVPAKPREPPDRPLPRTKRRARQCRQQHRPVHRLIRAVAAALARRLTQRTRPGIRPGRLDLRTAARTHCPASPRSSPQGIAW